MKTVDLLTAIFLGSGAMLAVAVYFLIKWKILRPTLLPLVLGIGGLGFAFVSLMISSIMLRPLESFSDYTLTNCILSGFIGISSYMAGCVMTRRYSDR